MENKVWRNNNLLKEYSSSQSGQGRINQRLKQKFSDMTGAEIEKGSVLHHLLD